MLNQIGVPCLSCGFTDPNTRLNALGIEVLPLRNTDLKKSHVSSQDSNNYIMESFLRTCDTVYIENVCAHICVSHVLGLILEAIQ